ncbi:hypothetical protein QTJ16_003554 [Diplocarpon rosae]|uniref:2EXR domain-containing protein n=1 Tax=Diplocarpon rosae TaxID=946125 RepID=A0AAD9WES2_9HELO|nr:hypothetical protein QTJ16_003554 [Diplocarpon rosae]
MSTPRPDSWTVEPLAGHKKKEKIYTIRTKRAFVLFPKLPFEIRELVFEFAKLGPQIVTIASVLFEADQASKRELIAQAFYNVPPLLHVNAQSRKQAKKDYELAFSRNLAGNPIYFNFKTDALLFDGEDALKGFLGIEKDASFQVRDISRRARGKLLVLALHEFDRDSESLDWLKSCGGPKHLVFVRRSGCINNTDSKNIIRVEKLCQAVKYANSTGSKRALVPVPIAEGLTYSVELRMMVLETAVSELAPRIVSVFDATPKKQAVTSNSPCKPVASYAIPALLHTYSESRAIVKKTYDAVFSENLRGSPVYFNFSQDILLFDDYKAMMWFFSFISHSGSTKRRILCGPVVEKKIPVVGILDVKWEHLQISGFLAKNLFAHSKEIILLRQDRVLNSIEITYRDWCVRSNLAILPVDPKPKSGLPIIGSSTVNQMRAKFVQNPRAKAKKYWAKARILVSDKKS